MFWIQFRFINNGVIGDGGVWLAVGQLVSNAAGKDMLRNIGLIHISMSPSEIYTSPFVW